MNNLTLTLVWIFFGFLFLVLIFISGSKKWGVFSFYSIICAYFEFYEFKTHLNILIFFSLSLFTIFLLRKEL